MKKKITHLIPAFFDIAIGLINVYMVGYWYAKDIQGEPLWQTAFFAACGLVCAIMGVCKLIRITTTDC